MMTSNDNYQTVLFLVHNCMFVCWKRAKLNFVSFTMSGDWYSEFTGS